MIYLKAKDVSLLEKLAGESKKSQFCELHHDSGYLTEDQAEVLKKSGIRLERQSRGYVRPVCKDIGCLLSVGCAHDERYRMAMKDILCAPGFAGSDIQHCLQLTYEINNIGREIHSSGEGNLDVRMVRARSDLSTEGALKRHAIALRHSELVGRLLEISNEVLTRYKSLNPDDLRLE